jgi:hypothetical protein
MINSLHPAVTVCTTRIDTPKFYHLPTQCIRVLFVVVRTHNDHFSHQQYMIAFYNHFVRCLLHSRRLIYKYTTGYTIPSRSQWPRGLRRKSVAVRMLRSWVQIPPRAWIFVCCDCCVLWGRGLCDEMIIRPEESYGLLCVMCDVQTSRMRRPWPALGRSATKTKSLQYQKVHSSTNMYSTPKLAATYFGLTAIIRELNTYSVKT